MRGVYLRGAAGFCPRADIETQRCGGGNSRPDDWVAACSEIITSHSVDGEALAAAYAQRGYAYTLLRKLPEAEKDLDQAIKINPKYATAYVNRANFWNVSGKPERALADSEQALRLDPKLPLAYYTRAGAALNLKQYDHAIADYSEALSLRPGSGADIYKLRGRAYYRNGDYKLAIADYDEQLKLDPKDVGTLLNRGDASRAVGDFSRAGADYNAAIRLAPDNPGGFNGRGFIRLATQDFKGAINDFDEAIHRGTQRKRGLCQSRRGAERAQGERARACRLRHGDQARTGPPACLRRPRTDAERHGRPGGRRRLDQQGARPRP